MRTPLAATAVTTLDSTGDGTAKVGPLSAREVWYPNTVHISVATRVKEARCSIYVGPDASQSNFRDESVFASSGDSSGTVGGDKIRAGSYVWAKWSGGDALQQAVLTVVGVKDV